MARDRPRSNTRKTAHGEPCHGPLLVLPRLRHGGVGGANGNSQSAWRRELLAPTPPGADIARPVGVSRQASIALI